LIESFGVETARAETDLPYSVLAPVRVDEHRDEAAVHALSARCTHLGCLVAWNRSDLAWECPCHGSRFAADGTLVQGPATAGLEQRELSS
jgi:Rieske Fe-S protein